LISECIPPLGGVKQGWGEENEKTRYFHPNASIYGVVARVKIQAETAPLAGKNKKAVLPQGNRAMPQVFFSVEVRQQHSLQA